MAKAIETVKQSNIVNYVMAHINCRLKVAFKNGLSKFFTDGDRLKRTTEEEINSSNKNKRGCVFFIFWYKPCVYYSLLFPALFLFT